MAYEDMMYAGGSRYFNEGTGQYSGGTPGVDYGTKGTPMWAGGQPQATPYVPKRGKKVVGMSMGGDNGGQEIVDWQPDPEVDYGPAPEAGFTPQFDNDGNQIGWYNRGQRMSAGGGGFFDFDGVSDPRTYNQYTLDAQGNPVRGDVTVSNTMTGKQKWMSTGVKAALLAMAGGAAATAAGGAGAGAGAGFGSTGAAGAVTPATAAELSALYGGANLGGAAGAGTAAAGAGSLLTDMGAAGAYDAGLAGVGSNAGQAVGGSTSLMDIISKGKDIYGGVSKLVGGGDNKGGGSSILDMINGYYSSQQNKDYSNNMKEFFAERDRLQQPYREKLQASYDNPDSFYKSNEYTGLRDIYKNQVDRQAAKGGTLANPTDRERLLQQHAMKEMDNYRKTLTGNINALSPNSYADMWKTGSQFERDANNPAWGAAARGGTGSMQNIVKAIGDTASTAEDIWSMLEEFFA